MIELKINKNIENILEKRLKEQKQLNKLEGEQWFRNPLGWLLVSFNNPLNLKNPNGELVVLQNNKDSIRKYIKGYSQIHYGVGVGETELEIIRQELEQSESINLEAIDINKTFIELFRDNLRDKEFEYGKTINAVLKQDLFQNYENPFKTNSVHVCLGGTIGNFDNSSVEMWKILSDNARENDLLILGIKSDKYFDIDIQKYKANLYYPSFILSGRTDIKPELISWNIDNQKYIRMSYDNAEVFRTRRFELESLKDEAKNYGFNFQNYWQCQYGHALVVLFKKIF